MLKSQYAIDEVFLKKPWKALTYSEIQKLSGKKSKAYIYKEFERLKQDRLIKSEKIGKRTIIYSMNLETGFSQIYWGLLHENLSWSRKKFPFESIENLKNKMHTSLFAMIVTGSYASGKFTSSSDLDVVIITNDTKKAYSELKLESETNIPKVHLHVFTEQEFLEMLTNSKENYGKEIARNCLIFFGGCIYYSILKEGISHGFKG